MLKLYFLIIIIFLITITSVHTLTPIWTGEKSLCSAEVNIGNGMGRGQDIMVATWKLKKFTNYYVLQV